MNDTSGRCQRCGAWLSTRYSAGAGPHQCEADVPTAVALENQARRERFMASIAVQPANRRQHMAAADHGPAGWSADAFVLPAATKPDLACPPMAAQRPPAAPARALAQAASYPSAQARQTAPASPAKALALAWVAGALAGGLVSLLLASLVWLPISP